MYLSIKCTELTPLTFPHRLLILHPTCSMWDNRKPDQKTNLATERKLYVLALFKTRHFLILDPNFIL